MPLPRSRRLVSSTLCENIIMKKIFEIISIGLIFLGLAVSFFETKGWLPNPKLDLANTIMNLGEGSLPLDTPYVDELILFFHSSKNNRINKNNFNEAIKNYEGIVIENIILDGHDVMGSVRIKKKNSNKVGIICGFQELQSWASDRQFIKWAGWIIALAGAIFTLLIFLSTAKENKIILKNCSKEIT